MNGKISASVMCADLCRLEKDIKILESSGVEFLHFDIMDGDFVPNYTLGNDIIRAVRSVTKMPFDIHLMINRPEDKIGWFDLREGDFVSIHYEATNHVQRTLQRIKDAGAKAALALNPATPLDCVKYILPDVDMILLMTVNPGYAGQKLVLATLEKIKELKQLLNHAGFSNIEIEVDGNVSFENAKQMRIAGADIFVAGSSSLFNKGSSLEESCTLLRKSII